MGHLKFVKNNAIVHQSADFWGLKNYFAFYINMFFELILFKTALPLCRSMLQKLNYFTNSNFFGWSFTDKFWHFIRNIVCHANLVGMEGEFFFQLFFDVVRCVETKFEVSFLVSKERRARNDSVEMFASSGGIEQICYWQQRKDNLKNFWRQHDSAQI